MSCTQLRLLSESSRAWSPLNHGRSSHISRFHSQLSGFDRHYFTDVAGFESSPLMRGFCPTSILKSLLDMLLKSFGASNCDVIQSGRQVGGGKLTAITSGRGSHHYFSCERR